MGARGAYESSETVGRKFDFKFTWQEYDWSCETYHKTGRMMPEDGIDQMSEQDAIYLGAVGYPGVPDHISLWGLLIPIRREFHQYVNLRPHAGCSVECPVRWLAGSREISTC